MPPCGNAAVPGSFAWQRRLFAFGDQQSDTVRSAAAISVQGLPSFFVIFG